MATEPAAPLIISSGTVNGLIFDGPRSSRTLCCVSSVSIPPMPEPMMTPTRSRSNGTLPSHPAFSTASTAAATAYRVNRSDRRASRDSMKSAASKSFTSHAILVLYSDVSKRVTSPAPDSPETIAFHVASEPTPSGETQPKPVTATRLLLMWAPRLGLLGVCCGFLQGHVDRVADRDHALAVVPLEV